jgi:hypothetical protein
MTARLPMCNSKEQGRKKGSARGRVMVVVGWDALTGKMVGFPALAPKL